MAAMRMAAMCRMAADVPPPTWFERALLVLLASASIGCTQVAAYDRGKLAHPTMTTKDLAGPAEAHVRAVHEGATGGAFEAGGGCGCN
jgi:hypothetical protein